MENFIPNEINKNNPQVSLWINRYLKTNIKNRLYKDYEKHEYKDEDQAKLAAFCKEHRKDVERLQMRKVILHWNYTG